MPDEGESGNSPSGPQVSRGRRMLVALMWTISLAMVAIVLVLSWTPDSRMTLVAWLPKWLSEWADSGEEAATMRTGVALAAAGFLFTLTARLSGLKHSCWIGFLLAALLVLTAEGGQWFLPDRILDWLDIVWGLLGAALGSLLVRIGFHKRSSAV